jgi:hypothetical protein
VLVPLAAATGLLLAACGGSASSADSPAVVPPSSAGTGSPAPGHSASGGGRAAPDATPAAGSAGATTAAAPASASTATSAVPGTAAQPATGGQVPLPPPGNYTYSLHGTSSSALGSQSLDGDSSLDVKSLSTTRERSTQRDKGGTTAETLVARTGGLYLADIHLSQSGFDEDFKPAQPVLLFPASAHRGQQWRWQMKSTDGKYTLTARLTLTDLHSSATTTQGQRYDTVSLSTVLHLHGSNVDLTIHQQDKASRDAVIVHEHAVSDGTAYGTHFHSDATRTLANRPS